MDKKCKICWGLLLLFLVLNIIFIGVWVNKTVIEKKGIPISIEKKKKYSERKYGYYLVKKLDMDSTQAKVYFALKKKHAKQMGLISGQIDSLRMLLGTEVFSNEQDSARVADLIKQITLKKMEFEWDNINYLKKVKSILSQEQREKFDEIHKNMMLKMKRHGRPPFHGMYNKDWHKH